MLDLCDINQTLLHLTVSGRKYPIRRRLTPVGLAVHYEQLSSEQRGWWEQISTVTAQTAIEQGIATLVRPDLLHQAIETAVRRSVIDPVIADQLRDILERKYQ